MQYVYMPAKHLHTLKRMAREALQYSMFKIACEALREKSWKRKNFFNAISKILNVKNACVAYVSNREG